VLAVVVGTGTEVGKTFVTSSLVRAARAAGHNAIGLKPIQTGNDTPSDAELLGAASGQLIPPLYAFPAPESPHSAARRAGSRIELSPICEWVTRHSRAFTLVETAGGAFTPLQVGTTNADLAVALRADGLIAVCAARLGILHDTGSMLLALAGRYPQLQVRAVVVSGADHDEARLLADEVKLCVVDRHAPNAVVLVSAPAGDLAAESSLWSTVHRCFT